MKEEIYFSANNIKKINSNIFELLSKKEQKLILKELKKIENNNIDLSKLKEEEQNKNSLLISSVYFNLTEVSIYLIDYLRNKIKSTTEFLDYLNLRNAKGYDALLYAAYRGNYSIFQKLLDNGAYLNSTNITGLNALHLAAQGNCLNIISALMEKYIFNINSQDINGNSALHWAVYFNNQQCIDYLLYYNIDLNLKDNNNCTAMDIAINRENQALIDKLKETIIIKYNLSKNSIQIGKFFTNMEIFRLWLRIYLYIPFLIIITLSEIYNQKLISLGIKNNNIKFIFIIFYLLMIFYYYILFKSDPDSELDKEINKSRDKNTLFSLLNQGNDLGNICPWCVEFMSPNSYHCPYCKKCIDFQEFHNSLLNNCIGKNNFRIYLIYLFFLSFVFTIKFFIGIYATKNIEFSLIKENKYNILFDIFINLVICGLCIFRLIRKINLFNISRKNKIGRYTNEKNNFFPELDNKISGLELN